MPKAIDRALTSRHVYSGGTPLPQVNYPPYRPFDRVPPELLSNILELTWLSYSGDDSADRFRFPSIPCKVNRYFNRIAISTPILWSYLRVTSVAELVHIEQRIHCRSGALPLDLYLSFHNVMYEEAMTLVETIITNSSSRFRAITLSYVYPAIIQFERGKRFWDHLSLLDGCPPHVTRFSIVGDSPSLDFLPPFTSSIRSLALSCEQFNWSMESFPNSLDILSIQENGGEEVSTADIAHFLSGPFFHSLQTLSLSFIMIERSDITLSKLCVLESLKHFKLGGFFLREVVMLLSSIRAPNLQYLSMCVVDENGDPFSDALAAAWNALRFPHLEKLTLEEFSEDTNSLVQFISNLPKSLTFLEIMGYGPVVALLRPPADTFCHQLCHIVAHGVPLNSLAALIRGRCASTLQRLEARYGTTAEAQSALKKERFMECLNTITASVREVTILLDEGDPQTNEATCLTVEQLAASFQE